MELNIEYQLLQQATQVTHKQTHTHTSTIVATLKYCKQNKH
jgi:hypothetical protein